MTYVLRQIALNVSLYLHIGTVQRGIWEAWINIFNVFQNLKNKIKINLSHRPLGCIIREL
jgi:hypothetical protein